MKRMQRGMTMLGCLITLCVVIFFAYVVAPELSVIL